MECGDENDSERLRVVEKMKITPSISKYYDFQMYNFEKNYLLLLLYNS